MLVLKQNAANTVPTPPAGKGTIFLTDNDDIAVKTNDGNVTTFPTVGGSNTQVFFNDEGAIGGSANMVFNKTTNVLTVTGNVAATNVLTDNLKYANGANWDLQQPGGSNTQLQFNDADSFGGSANLTFDKTSNTLALLGTANITDINTTGNVLVGGNLTVNGNVTYINVDTLNVEDPIISLGGGPNGTPLSSDDGKDRGTALQYYSGTAKTAFMGWDNSNAEFGMGAVTTVTNDVVTFSTYGNLRVGNIIGNGQALTGITGANVTGQVANALVAGTVYTNAQPNITSVGTLTSLAVTGNTTTGNLSGANLVSANFLTGTLTTAAQPNITSVGKLVSVLIGSTANASDFPNAIAIASQDNTGITGNENIGLVGEGVGNGVESIGVLGAARANGAQKATGLQGTATVTATGDTGAAVGVRGYSTTTHAGGYNIGVLGNAMGSGVGNYAFYVQNGGVASIENDTFWDLNDNSATALAFNSSGKGNILAISTVDGSETVNMSGKLNVTGNANVGNVGTTHLVVTGNVTGNLLPSANVTYNLGSPTQAWGQLYLAGNTITLGTQTITSNATAISLTGLLSGNGGGLNNLNASNLASGTVASARLSGTYTITVDGSANTVRDAAQPNITSVGTLTSLSVTGNVTSGNVSGGNVVSANFLTGTLTTAAQPNITSIGTLTSVTTSGNVVAGNVYANSGTVGASLLTGTLTTASQPNVTSVGTLTSLTVTGTATAGNLSTGGTLSATGNANVGNLGTGGLIVATGNVTGGNLVTSGALSVTGNANVGNIGGAAGIFTTVAGSLTTASQPNITSVGTLTSLSVTGNASAGNLSITGTGSFGGNVAMGNYWVTGLNAPVNDTDAATKKYVDDVAQGLNVHDAAAAATTGTLATATGGTITYNNGTSGVGATLTTTGTYTTIDGVNIATVGTRVLVKNEANAAHNGIYTYTSSTVLTRATDYNSVPEVEAGDFIFVTGGTVYDNTGWVQTSTVATIGTDAIDFTQFSGAGTYNAGTGLTLTGSTFSVNASQTQVTALGTVTTGTWNSLVGSSATFAAGLSGANLASITGANVTGTVSAATTAGTVTTAAQPNITSVGTLTSLAVTGNVSAANLTGAHYGNGAALEALNASNITSGTLAQARLANSSLTVNGSSVSLGGSVTVTATATNALTLGSYLTGTSYNGSTAVTAAVDATTTNTASKVVARDASGNFAAGTITATLSGAATTAGTVTTAAQPNITSVGTLTTLSVSGATSVTGNSALTVTNLTSGANTTAGYMTGNWTLTAGSKFNATYADLAEKYVADADYEPGTVLVFGGEHEVTIATEQNSTRVAGVVSTDPAYVMNSGCTGEHVVVLALTGRVPVKVSGQIQKGDLIVSGTNGHAIANNMARAGTIIGKALENFVGESGVIEVVVGRV